MDADGEDRLIEEAWYRDTLIRFVDALRAMPPKPQYASTLAATSNNDTALLRAMGISGNAL